MNPLVAAYPLAEEHEHLRGQVAEALQGVLTDEMRTYGGTHSALIDGEIAGDDFDGTAFPLWPGRAF